VGVPQELVFLQLDPAAEFPALHMDNQVGMQRRQVDAGLAAPRRLHQHDLKGRGAQYPDQPRQSGAHGDIRLTRGDAPQPDAAVVNIVHPYPVGEKGGGDDAARGGGIVGQDGDPHLRMVADKAQDQLVDQGALAAPPVSGNRHHPAWFSVPPLQPPI
jgi:hypothetical protein